MMKVNDRLELNKALSTLQGKVRSSMCTGDIFSRVSAVLSRIHFMFNSLLRPNFVRCRNRVASARGHVPVSTDKGRKQGRQESRTQILLLGIIYPSPRT